MSIGFNIKCTSVQEMEELRETMNRCLRGCSAVAFEDLQDDAFTMFVGDYDKEGHNVEYDVHIRNLKER